MMAIESFDVYGKMAVSEKILSPRLVIYTSQCIGFHILPDITGEFVDIRTAIYSECTVSFYHPATRYVTGLE